MPVKTPLKSLETYLDRWATLVTSATPGDRQAAEDGVHLAYASANLAPPQRIVWCGGPLEIAEHLCSTRLTDPIGPNVKARIFDDVRDRIGTFAEIFWKEIVVAASEHGNKAVGRAIDHYNKSQVVNAAVSRVVCNAAAAMLFRPALRARHMVMRLRGQARLLPRTSFHEVAVAPTDLDHLAVYEYLHDVLGWHEPTCPMQGWWKIAKGASWIVPYEHVCWLAERPRTLQTDANMRLHCVDGPALAYRDGWSAHMWKGVEVPAWVIEHPERITLSTLAETIDPILRNSMIDIMTPERFVNSGGPFRVCQDETGILWQKNWTYRGITIGSWTAVEVTNGTPAPDGSRKRYFLRVPSRIRSACEAVAWTYGLTAERYKGLKLRT